MVAAGSTASPLAKHIFTLHLSSQWNCFASSLCYSRRSFNSPVSESKKKQRTFCYFFPLVPGKNFVFSITAAARESQSESSTSRMVHAICLISTGSVLVVGVKWGLDRTIGTWLSSSVNPPCSIFLAPLVL